MAEYFDMPLPELLQMLEAGGYPWLPDPDNLDEGEALEDIWLHEAWDVREWLHDLAVGPTLRSLLAGVPERFIWDETTIPPGLPPIIPAAIEWIEHGGSWMGVAESSEMRSGMPENVIWVSSAIALSRVRYVLDKLGRNARIVLKSAE